MRVTRAALIAVAFAACFPPDIADGSVKCEVGDECPPPTPYCRPECGRRCFVAPTGSCGADAPPAIDGPLVPPVDAPAADGPIVSLPDGPIIVVPDGPVVEEPPPDAPGVPPGDAPSIDFPDACTMIRAIDDAGIGVCTALQ